MGDSSWDAFAALPHRQHSRNHLLPPPAAGGSDGEQKLEAATPLSSWDNFAAPIASTGLEGAPVKSRLRLEELQLQEVSFPQPTPLPKEGSTTRIRSRRLQNSQNWAHSRPTSVHTP